MIRPPGFRGAAFGDAAAGDVRMDDTQRRAVAGKLGISPEWSFVNQVHGTRIVEAAEPGSLGEADAIFTQRTALPIAVATADCVPVILEGEGFAAVVHAGWRGASGGVLQAALRTLNGRGLSVSRAAIGPSIGPCCYEVGAEVAERFPENVAATGWGSTSVDLAGFLAGVLNGVPVWRSKRCTFTDESLYSYRRNRTRMRQVAVAWLPAA